MVALVRPDMLWLPAYRAALAQGWSPDNLRPAAAGELLAASAADPADFLVGLDDPAPEGRTVTLPDGSRVPRLPSLSRWIIADGFVGQISLRWQPGGDALPPYVLGHIGYGVVPWARRRGHAGAALGLILPEARAQGLTRVELTTEPDNIGSIRVIEKNGGRLVERFTRGPQYGQTPALRFVIAL